MIITPMIIKIIKKIILYTKAHRKLLSGGSDEMLVRMGLERSFKTYAYTASGSDLAIGKLDDKRDFGIVSHVRPCVMII